MHSYLLLNSYSNHFGQVEHQYSAVLNSLASLTEVPWHVATVSVWVSFRATPHRFTTGESEESQRATKISPRWPTKVFAVECSRKIYAVCKSDRAHFDLALAQKKKNERGGEWCRILCRGD